MYNPDEYSDLIQEHLKGLSTSEQNVFVANELNTNPDFKEQYANEKMVFEAIVLSELFDLENTIRNFEPKPKKTSPWIFLGALIGVALLVTGAYKAYDLRNTPISNIEKVILTTPIIATETQIDSVRTIPASNKSKPLEKVPLQNKIQGKTTIVDSSTMDSTVIPSLITTDTTIISIDSTALIIPENSLVILPDTSKENCFSTNITFESHTTSTCENDPTGSILIYGIKGGNGDYAVTLNDALEKENLPAGNYEVVITDKLGCMSEPKDVYIASRECFETKDFVFAISQDTYFSMPVSGRLLIINSSGGIVFDKELMEEDQWYIKKNNGESLSMGDYNYIIKSDSDNYTGVFTILE